MNEPIENLRELAKIANHKPNGSTLTLNREEPPETTRLPARSVELPAERAAAVAYGLEQFQSIAHERDELRNENTGLRDRVAALEIEAEGLRSHITDGQSHIKSAYLVRDQAMADRIKYEALFVSVQAQLRAFQVPAEPLIRDTEEQ